MAEFTYYAGVRESAAGAAKRHLALFNPAGSGKILKVYRISAAGQPAAAATGLIVALAAKRITTAPTGGAAGSFAKADTADPNVPAGIVAMVGATGGATEDAIDFGYGTVTGEETAAASNADLYRANIDGTKPEILREGEGVLVKQGTLASAGNVSISIAFTIV